MKMLLVTFMSLQHANKFECQHNLFIVPTNSHQHYNLSLICIEIEAYIKRQSLVTYKFISLKTLCSVGLESNLYRLSGSVPNFLLLI